MVDIKIKEAVYDRYIEKQNRAIDEYISAFLELPQYGFITKEEIIVEALSSLLEKYDEESKVGQEPVPTDTSYTITFSEGTPYTVNGVEKNEDYE